MRASPLAERAETALRRLRDVEGVSVQAHGDELIEVHVVSGAERPAKQIVRDVQAMLRTELGLSIDHRIVSVAFVRPSGDSHAAPAPASAAAPPPPAPESADRDRIRFENVNLIVHGPRTQAQVELRWKGLPRVGNASGYGSRDDSQRLVAQATTLAVQEFLADPVALSVRDVAFVEVAGKRVAVVVLSLLAHRHEKLLTGSCTVDLDTPQAVVLATLDALNRVVAGMRAKEPTEYVLRAESYAFES